MSSCSALVSPAGLAGAQLLEMPLRHGALEIAEALLLGDQPARRADILEHQHRSGQMQVLEQLAVHLVDLREAVLRQAKVVLDALGGELHQVLVDDVARMFEVDGEGQDIRQPLGLLVVERLVIDRAQIAAHRAVEPVDHVVGAADRLDLAHVALVEEVLRAAQHRLDDIAHAQHLARGVRERDGGRVEGVVVEILRHAGIGGADLVGEGLHEQPWRSTAAAG